jgi:hypothetical protein
MRRWPAGSSRLSLLRERHVGPQCPGLEFGGVLNADFVVLDDPGFQIAGQTNVALGVLGLALEEVDICSGSPITMCGIFGTEMRTVLPVLA